MKIATMVFCILACLCVAAAIPLGALVDWLWFAVCVAAALLFGGAMLLTKKLSAPPETHAFLEEKPSEKDDSPAEQ